MWAFVPPAATRTERSPRDLSTRSDPSRGQTLAKSFNPWPVSIIGFFLVFILAMTAWITVALRNSMDLVRADYYEAEVRFQQHIDQANRARAWQSEIAIEYKAADNLLLVRLPRAHLSQNPVGAIHLYRPSDAALDRKVPLALDSTGLQRISTGDLRRGLWKVRLAWSAGGEEFFTDTAFVAAN